MARPSVRIEGTFREPTVDVVSEELMAKSLAALALGVVLPVIGAILPFFEPGETRNSNCAHLLEAAAAASQRRRSNERWRLIAMAAAAALRSPGLA